MDQNYKIGEYIIDFVCIYQITSISKDNNENRLIHYQPVKGTDKIFTDIIPEKNLVKGGLRRLLTPKEVESILSQLKTPLEDYIYDPRQIKEDIYLNQPDKMAVHLKYLWGKEGALVKTDIDLRNEIIDHLCLELAFIANISIPSIRKTIEDNLNQGK